MKITDIVVGTAYTNGKRRYRLVVDEGEDFKLYPSQEDADCLLYFGFRANRKDELVFDSACGRGHTTRRSMASWAKRALTPTEAEPIRVLAAHRPASPSRRG